MRQGCIAICGVCLFLLWPLRICFAENLPETATRVNKGWQTAPKYSAGIAPDPLKNKDQAIIQVMIAKTYGWRGYFAVHPWIIFKRSGETGFTRYEVVGWGGGTVIRKNRLVADGFWYGSRPEIIVDKRGKGVDMMIDQVIAAIKTYPYPNTYRSYPGPNSNSFIAHIGREVPALKLDLPANAIGKDYRPISDPVGMTPSGRGIQVNLFGLLGISLGLEEGIEFNVLGLNFGVDFNRPALRVPSVGRIGMDNGGLYTP